MKRPKYLYHASENKDIEILEPRMQSVRDSEEGPVVFSTQDKALATCFIVNTNDTWANMGRVNNIIYFVCSDENRFRKLDKGGAIYTLQSRGFKVDLNKGMGLDEWVSKTSTRPVEKIEYESGLEAMMENGVKVFFVDLRKFNKFMNSYNGKREILGI